MLRPETPAAAVVLLHSEHNPLVRRMHASLTKIFFGTLRRSPYCTASLL